MKKISKKELFCTSYVEEKERKKTKWQNVQLKSGDMSRMIRVYVHKFTSDCGNIAN